MFEYVLRVSCVQVVTIAAAVAREYLNRGWREK